MSSLSIGIPSYSSLVLPIYEMTLTCSDKRVNSINIERDIRYEAQKRIADRTGTWSSNKSVNILQEINFMVDDNAFSILGLDDKQRVINIFRSLIDLDRKDSLDSLLSQVKDGNKELRDIVRYVNNNQYSSIMHNDLKKKIPGIYFGKAYGVDLRHYLNVELEHYLTIYNNMDKIFDIDYSDMFNRYLDSLSIEKVKLYLAYYYMDSLLDAIKVNDFNLAQDCCFYLNSYFKGSSNNKLFISGDIVSFDILKRRYEDILRRYPNLNRLDKDREFFLYHSKEDNLSVIDSLLKMRTIRTNEFFVKGGNDDSKSNGDSRVVTPLTEEEERVVKEYMDNKLYTYLKNKPLAQIVCTNSFANYIAYLFSNGMITADRMLRVNRVSEMQSDAVYVFDADNFEDKIVLNKQQLRGNTPRILHIPGWEDRIGEIASMSTSDSLREDAISLVKRRNI